MNGEMESNPSIDRAFWDTIEFAMKSDNPRTALHQHLESRGFDEIVRFDFNLRLAISGAWSEGIGSAAYIMLGFLTDSAMEDYVSWIILGGREVYQNALQNPDSIAESTGASQLDGPLAEWLHLLPSEIAESMGREEELDESVAACGELRRKSLDIKTESDLLRERFPRLFELYWHKPWQQRR